MIANKHVTKIVIVLMAIAVIVCILAVGFSSDLNEAYGGTGITMEYETKLFDTSEAISIDIQMDEEEWEKMLANASSEEYYVCNVVVNGQKFQNVAIRPKGNTSLSAIAMDPDTDRFSLKLEFDHFVSQQTCYGLDKLILNNNYADATNMKETVIYDMYQYLGADASLYNYAKVSINGEYWGVYLALEAVEDSFMLRNYGTQDGELYKPESLGMGGGGGNKGGDSDFSFGGMDFSNFDFSNVPGDRPGTGGSTSSGESGAEAGTTPAADSASSPVADSGQITATTVSTAGGNASGFDSSTMSGFDGSSFDPNNMPNNAGGAGFDASNFDPSAMSGFDGSSFDPNNMGDIDMSNFDMSNKDMSNFGGGGGGSSSNGGANLNYTDDDLDSYSTIWEGAVTNTSKSDHRRVVTALKNINEGTNLEDYLDIDNVLKYMAVHTFSVNMDSLSGSMAHNYYIYEFDGKLNMIPWDYNLSLGGMSMGNSGNATDMVNDPIDTPFSGTKFFDKLLENEEYLAKYHEYLQMLVDEYVYGGKFDELYSRVRNQIDSLVETDPTAFYTYEEYQVAAETLYETIQLRADSIKGQLEGVIPSTDAGQKADSSNLVDASHIDVSIMGQFNMGGMTMGGGMFSRGNSSKTENTSSEGAATDSGASGSESVQPDNAQTDSAQTEDNSSGMAGGFSGGSMPEGMTIPNGGSMPDGASMPEGMTMPNGGSMPDGASMPNGMTIPNGGSMPDGASMPDGMTMPGGNNSAGASGNDDNSAAATAGSTASGSTSSGDSSDKSRPSSFGGMNFSSSSFAGMGGQAGSSVAGIIIVGACFVVMVFGIFFVKRYKRKW